MKLLVTYASKYGATAEIAEGIGKELRIRQYDVDVKPVNAVDSLTGYDGFVIGSAVYAGSWIKSAAKFLRANETLLSNHPVWFFSSGPTGQGDPNELMDGWNFPENLTDSLEKIKPKNVILFHGNIAMDKLNFAERMIVKSLKATVGDYRDWLVIRGWARRIDLDLQES
jgi:menaquinone-dependent protoporphyrinogen oxidase